MRYNIKKSLYESIINDVARIVKRRLNERNYDFVTTNTGDDVDDIISTQKEREMMRYIKKFGTQDGITVISDIRYGKMNYMNEEGNILSDTWFDFCYAFQDGFGKVELHSPTRRFNFINKFGKLISKKWFAGASSFVDGISLVRNRNKYNYLSNTGKLLSNVWFDKIKPFNDGVALVYLNDMLNCIDKSGKLLFKTWFSGSENVSKFVNGFAIVETSDGKKNFIDKTGELLSKKWFDDCREFGEEGYAIVLSDNRCNLIDKEGRLLFDKWFDSMSMVGFCDGFLRICKKGKWNFIDVNGRVLMKIWVDGCGEPEGEYAKLTVNSSAIWLRPWV